MADEKRQETRSGGVMLLASLITLVALIDGVLHLILDYVLFKGQLWGKLTFARPAGKLKSGMMHSLKHAAPMHMFHSNPILNTFDISKITGLPLNELFVLNAVGYLVLLVIFWSWPKKLRSWRWIVDILLIGYAIAAIISWFNTGMPNPHNLGYLSKALEVVLIILVALHSWMILKKKPDVDSKD